MVDYNPPGLYRCAKVRSKVATASKVLFSLLLFFFFALYQARSRRLAARPRICPYSVSEGLVLKFQKEIFSIVLHTCGSYNDAVFRAVAVGGRGLHV